MLQIEKMMRKAYSQTESILKTHYDKLELVAETLIKNEKISGDQFTQLMENGFFANTIPPSRSSKLILLYTISCIKVKNT